MRMLSESRRSPRYQTPWRALVPLTDANVMVTPGRVLNASLDGLFIAMKDPPEVGQLIVAEIDAASTTVMVTGNVVHRQAEFVEPGCGLLLVQKPAVWDTLVRRLVMGAVE